MKTIQINGVGDVTIKKSSRARRLILKISQTGEPQVTIPSFSPYIVGEQFAKAHADWFRQNMPQVQKVVINEGKVIGWKYQVNFEPAQIKAVTSRVGKDRILVKYPAQLSIEDEVVQKEARKACTRALRRLAEVTLPPLLHNKAVQFGYNYKEVRVKAVKTRWGSCSSNRVINLSIWLMQLPDELVEYVICHELTHLNHMHHGPDFWAELAAMIPDHKKRRAAIKQYRPTLL